jgi:2'-5' RNA ligase
VTHPNERDPRLSGNPAEEPAPGATSSPTPYPAPHTDPLAPAPPRPPRSEAVFVPQEPKLYVSSSSEEEDDAEPVDTWRLFVAIELPRTLKREFIDLARSFRPREYERVRWIEQEAMHLTLKFLGDTPVDRVPDIKAALERAASSTGKFSIRVGRTGCFPSFRDPRICWVGLSGELRRLEQLQGRVEGGLVALGYDREDRKFKPHVTVGRTRPGIRGRFAEDIGVSWRHAPLHSTGTTIPVSAIALYRSYLGETGGARYEQLANLELG